MNFSKLLLTLSTLVAAISMNNAFAVSIECSGTEPFWGYSSKKLAIGKTVTYHDAGQDKDYSLKVTDILQASNVGDYSSFVITTKYSSLTAIQSNLTYDENGNRIEDGCSNGMSDADYSHFAVFREGKNVLTGCCNVKK